jgi:RHH-type proline utilization regulon transcriptional repressor/proline dehydrogenase/delta 1-pyrroline-5-carboxylate dehydrogenase
MQAQIEALGLKLFEEMRGEKPGVFNSDYWQGKLMDWVMKDPSFKVDLFRFVDVLPQLETSEQVAKHVREYLLKEGRVLPGVISVALKAAASGLTAGIAAKSIRKNISDMAERFIMGHDAKSAIRELQALHKQGIAFTVDLLGEYTLSDPEADQYQNRYLDLIHNLVDACEKWPADSVIDALPRVNVSIKVSALDPQIKAVDPAGSVQRLRKRLLPLFVAAQQNNVFLNLDLETWELHEVTYDLFESLVNYPNIGIVVQAYLKNSMQDLQRLLELAKLRKAPIGVRLVKGAYWDYEVVNAQQKGFECPVFTDKAETDLNYERLSRFMLDNIEYFRPAFGSHNLRSISQAIVYAESKNIPKSAYEIQMLYGMAEPERKVLRARGHRVRVYAPIGELLPGMAYLVRRLLENTSNSGFLRMSHQDNIDAKALLSEPSVALRAATSTTLAFTNCPFTDFTVAANREKFQHALDGWQKKFPVKVPVVLAGEAQPGESSFERVTPNDGSTVVAQVELASIAQAEQAIQIATKAYPEWRDKALSERVACLNKLADILERDRFELAALQCYEVAKPWLEADGDVAEAIDFCRYYALSAMQELAPRKQGNIFGEDNILSYEGRGPSLVIAPWNFPLAILCGMATAALVAGNTVILKPAETSSLVAKTLFDRISEAGFPKEVCQFLSGRGSQVGAYLVEHPQIAQIAFTGSKEVGLQIIEKAAKTKPEQPQVKRVVCEMGGKNAIIIDDDADLDEAALGVVHSAFGFAGQKCSAASRVLIHEAVYETFTKRLIEACRSLTVSSALMPSCTLPPVIDQKAQERLLNEIQQAKQEHKLLFLGQVPQVGFFVPVALFEVSDANNKVMQSEFFGPVIGLLKVKSFEEALQVATGTEFALTGAVYSRSPKHLEEARKAFRVGNLYLNRGSTGALVYRQPFGGFKMSGIGTKAGGPGYLLNFVDPRVVTENTLRRGFTPDLE